MKITKWLPVILILVSIDTLVYSQQIALTTYKDDCKIIANSGELTYFNDIKVDFKAKTFTYCLDGKLVTNKLKLPEGEGWYTSSIGNELYFHRTNFKNDIYTHEYTHYDFKANVVGQPVTLLTVKSSSDPSWNGAREFTSPNNKYKAIRVNPGKNNSTATSIYLTSTSTAITVFNQALEILYSKELAFEFSDKEFEYDVSNFLTDDGTWYWFGIKYSGKGDTKKGQYGCYITNPEGNTSAFMPINFDKGYIQDVNNIVKDGKLIQFGTWSNDDMRNTLSGSFYMELDPSTMEVINLQTTDLSGDDLGKFVFTSGLQSRAAKKMHMTGIEYIDLITEKPQFEDGRYIAVYRRNINTSLQDPTFEIGSYIIMTFGPKADNMTHTFVRVNQRSPGREIPFNGGAGFINNTVVLFFNDHEANAGITQKGDPKLFEPFPVQQKATTTYAVLFSQDGTLKREQIASYRDDNRVFYSTGRKITDNSLIIYMREDPPMKLVDDAFGYDPGTPYQFTLTK